MASSGTESLNAAAIPVMLFVTPAPMIATPSLPEAREQPSAA